MNSQKIENILNLSLDATMEEREKSNILNVGYDANEKTWEIIVKYQGDITRLASEVVEVEILLNGYAIITLPESLLESVTKLPEIEYIEKPKNLIYNIYQAKIASCVIPYTIGTNKLSGQGVLIAIIDSGIDYLLPDFQNESGTRIQYLWDQSLNPDVEKGYYAPRGFGQGVEFSKEAIQKAIMMPTRVESLSVVSSMDVTGHGTAVASIAASSSSNQIYQGMAPDSELLIVKLGGAKVGGFPRTTELMRGITYCLQKAKELEKPMAMNLSFGNTYGAHDGSSLLERFLDNAAEVGRTSIVVGSGNEGVSAGHVSGKVEQLTQIELLVGQLETGLTVQLWKNYVDEIEITLVSPTGKQYQILQNKTGTDTIVLDDMKILVYRGEPTPYSVNQEIFFDMIPDGDYLQSGIWIFQLKPVKIVTGLYQCYLPSESIRNRGTRFVSPSTELTLTIPSTANKVITVGAYDTVFDAYADFSGRGRKVNDDSSQIAIPVKPDLVAPGVNIVAARSGGGYEVVTGTSFATPVVTGAAALLMEDGIVKGEDIYCYGEKLKAKLLRSARKLSSEVEVPNERTGWGALCLNIME